MIAKTTSAPRFFPLAAYLAAGTDGRHHERVEWTAARRLTVADLAVAPAIMEATAYRSVRVEQPCYHVVVSFDTRDHPTRVEMEGMADRLLARLGLSEHQALLVAHNDRPCAHVHIMVNRVHPETGVAWERWKDRHLIEAALRDAERDLAMREVPGRLSPALDREHSIPAAREPDLTWGERRLADRTGRRPLLDRARDALTDCRQARSWRELGAALAQRGLAVARTAKGIVITDGDTHVRASRVAPDLGLPRLEARFAERLPDPVASPGIERIVGLVRLLTAGESIERNARDAAATLQHASAELTTAQVVGRQTVALLDQLAHDFDQVYSDPHKARIAFKALERLHGTAHACALLADSPEQLGALRAARTSRTLRAGGTREPANTHRAVTQLSRLARDTIRATEGALTTLSEAAARARFESAAAHARKMRETLAQHRARHSSTDRIREQLALEVTQLGPGDASALQHVLTSAESALARSCVAGGRELRRSQERSRD